MSPSLALVSDRPWPNKQASPYLSKIKTSFNSNDFSKFLLFFLQFDLVERLKMNKSITFKTAFNPQYREEQNICGTLSLERSFADFL